VDARLVIVITVAVVAILLVAFFVLRKKRTENLRKRFGPEYERTVREIGPRRAELNLREREKRVEKFSIRGLSAAEREHFLTEWRVVQSRFVDDPRGAAADADALVNQLMQARGYPMSDFSQRAADISVDHPRVVDNYRAAHEIALRQAQASARLCKGAGVS
jgi:FtsZ-interacting cell division protein ZipA